MKTYVRFLILFVFGLLPLKNFGQNLETEKSGSLIVYGDGFLFGIDEPEGWTGDIEHSSEYYSNIIFYKSNEGLEKANAIVQVASFAKHDEKMAKDLKFDVKQYKHEFKKLKQQDITFNHEEYKCYSKLMYVEDDFYQYTVYVNPGEKFNSGFSVAMNVQKRPASEDELMAFQEIIKSLLVLK